MPDQVDEGLTAAQIYVDHCAGCHEGEGTRAPARRVMAAKDVAQIRFSLTNGTMRAQTRGLSLQQIFELADYISDPTVGSQDVSFCEPSSAGELSRQGVEQVGKWGVDLANTAHSKSRITASNVARLTLDWAFRIPGVTTARGQPVVHGERLYLGTTAGDVFALERKTGCVVWRQRFEAGLRTALVLGRVDNEWWLFVGDNTSETHALRASDGQRRWSVSTAVDDSSIQTGAPVFVEDMLIVPVSLMEAAHAQSDDYPCCKGHGALIRLDARTGDELWRLPMTAPAKQLGTKEGVARYGPSGVPIWSTPTVDLKRRQVYVGTGQHLSPPANNNSDAVLAVGLDSGEIIWRFQGTLGDIWNSACSGLPPGRNCPRWSGPDHDFGAAVVIANDREGDDILLAGQKSGDVYALRPDDGELIWRTRVGAGSALGGVHWGMTTANGRVYVGISDPPFPKRGIQPRPGLYALSVDDGEVIWETLAERGCDTGLGTYFSREELYPDCSLYFGLSAAVTSTNDLVFAPRLDGRLEAYDANSGVVLWRYETARSFTTTDNGSAHGGAIDNAGAVLVDDMLFIQSGYDLFGQLPGNVLLAFSLTPGELMSNHVMTRK
ncbi:MAG: PQQ-binding-like beta-propeller repeat protein [Pseudomonadota bacterium]